MIPLNRPIYDKKEQEYLLSAMKHKTGQTSFCDLCGQWLSKRMEVPALMTNSCSTALDLAAELLHLQAGDEVLLPSFTFSSTANAFVRQGVVPVFVDIRQDTMNLDETKLEAAITEKTKAIVPMHYAGISCEMDTILNIAEQHGLAVIEDAAQAMLSTYKGRLLGTLGSMGCVSFHATKNFSMGEGGALFLREKELLEEAEVLAECGTSRCRFRRGEETSYTWLAAGASCLPSEPGCMFLYPQLLQADEITKNRKETWNFYKNAFTALEQQELLRLPMVPEGCVHNGHIFYIRLQDKKSRDDMIAYLSERGIQAAFHYVPLHSSPAGRRYGRFHGEDNVTTAESEKLLRLPLSYGMTKEERERVAETVCDWFRK